MSVCLDSASLTYVRALLRKLLLNFRSYFSKDCTLNSDGRRVLNEVVRAVVANCPTYVRVAKDVRRNPTLEELRKLATLFMRDDEFENLLLTGVGARGPYRSASRKVSSSTT